MESGSNKSLYTLIAVVVFGIFLSLSYYLYQDQLKVILADVMDSTSQMTSTKLDNYGLIPTDEKYFDYNLGSDGTYRIDKYTGPATTVVIPTYIDGIKVTTIGSNAFTNTGIIGIHFSEFVSKIEDSTTNYIGAFTGTNLGVVTIPSTLTYIGNNAFSKSGLLQLTLEDGVKHAGTYAFYGNNLTTIYIPPSLTTLSGGLFERNSLKTAIVAEGVTTLRWWVFGANNLESLILPSTVTSLDSTFAVHNYGLTSLSLPKNLETSINSRGIYQKYDYFDSTTGTFINIVKYANSIINFY